MKRFFITLLTLLWLPLCAFCTEDAEEIPVLDAALRQVTGAQTPVTVRPDGSASAVAVPAAQYEAFIIKDTFLRVSPGGDRIEPLKEGTRITVSELGEEWSLVMLYRKPGYVETNRLARFRSLNPKKYPVPGRTVNAGAVTLTQPASIRGGRFEGLEAQKDAVICALSADDSVCRLAIWRGEGEIPAEVGAYSAFTAWESAQPGDLIGGFTTYYNEQTGAPLAAQRAYNITLACQRIDGCELAPGASFSFNRKCAPYSQNNRYQVAKNISAKGVGYGGGVCQVSTTLYNALLALPLQVDSVAIHRKNGVNYIPQWFDSAVGSYSDLTFTNTLPYPIRLWAQPQDGALTVLIYRAEEPAAQDQGA